MSSFSLNIDLGNAAMESADDVAVALRGIADQLESESPTTGAIRDENGNTVGRWTMSDGLPS